MVRVRLGCFVVGTVVRCCCHIIFCLSIGVCKHEGLFVGVSSTAGEHL